MSGLSRRLPVASLVLCLLAAFAAGACGQRGTKPGPQATRERAYRANNVGVALLEQLKYPEAAAAFRDALRIDGTLAIGHLNLALALMYAQDLDGAAREASTAAGLMPDAPQPPYVLGLVARAQNRNDAARGYFEAVVRIDSTDVGANVNLAQINLEDRRYSEAVAELKPVVAAEPYHVTAAYVLGLALTRNGDTDEGQRLLERAQGLRRANYAVTFGTGYLEQGRYAEAIASTGAEPDLVDPATSAATFTASGPLVGASGVETPSSPFGRRYEASELDDSGVRELAGALGGGQALVDVDGDGILDLVVVSAQGQRLYHHAANGEWTDVTPGSGLETVPAGSVPVGVVSADIDNDGAADLFVLRLGSSSLYRNDGKGHFTDITKAAGVPDFPELPGTAAFVDVDHDGDVDLVIGGLADVAATLKRGPGPFAFPAQFAPAPLHLLRNNRNGTFTDVTHDAKLDVPGHAIAIAPTDFDNHRDIDLLVVNADAAPELFANQRDGSFLDVAADVGLGGVAGAGESVTAVAVGDVNKDDWPDFFFAGAGAGGGVLALSDGRGRFHVGPAPDMTRGATAAQFIDYDNDGLLDLVVWTPDGPRVARNLGATWRDVTSTAVGIVPSTMRAPVRGFSAADVDRDGHTDLVATVGSAAWLWRNTGAARNHSLRVQLKGRVTNREGVGSKVEVRAGSLRARVETSAASPAVAPADVLFGLGARPGADVARVLWPSGILQAETAAAATAPTAPPAVLPSPFLIEELDRKPSSCPFLFAWNGERFEFVTDFLGGGEMGDWEARGSYNTPDPIEYVRIRGDQLRPVDGRLQLRVTNELEEVLYLDRLQLVTVSHPADVQVYPNEGMTDPPKPFRLHAVRAPHPPLHVVDDAGRDVTERVARLDRRYPDFAVERIRGYAVPHALTIDIGAASSSRTLLLTGWTDYAFSSDNVAASQAGLRSVEPTLEVHGADGGWRRIAVPIGIPVGRPQTIPLDLTGQLRSGEHELRLTTNMRIYWDQILVGDTVSAGRFTSTIVDPRSATLRARGFSAEVRPGGEEPPVYDYAHVSAESPWKAFTGHYTREGDVLELLTQSDDRFVIGRPGDEVALEFDASEPRSLPEGWTRTYLLRGDGFSKEMDVNSASPDTVEPLPFHAMSRYPYPATEHYPDGPAQQSYRDTFNTRRVIRAVPKF